MREGHKKLVWLARRLSFVPRWVVVPMVRRQNVAEHSYHVAMLCNALLDHHERCDDVSFRHSVLVGALDHDCEEARSGDHPSPSKDGTRPKASDLCEIDIVIKVADKIEAALYCHEDMELGNKAVSRIMDDAIKRGESYWEFFKWQERLGSKPSFECLVRDLGQACSLNRHPVLDL